MSGEENYRSEWTRPSDQKPSNERPILVALLPYKNYTGKEQVVDVGHYWENGDIWQIGGEYEIEVLAWKDMPFYPHSLTESHVFDEAGAKRIEETAVNYMRDRAGLYCTAKLHQDYLDCRLEIRHTVLRTMDFNFVRCDDQGEKVGQVIALLAESVRRDLQRIAEEAGICV